MGASRLRGEDGIPRLLGVSVAVITFDFDHPASKLAPHPTLSTFFVGDGTYISAFVFDSSHGFTNCVRLRG